VIAKERQLKAEWVSLQEGHNQIKNKVGLLCGLNLKI
jgi:hypothetical protein